MSLFNDLRVKRSDVQQYHDIVVSAENPVLRTVLNQMANTNTGRHRESLSLLVESGLIGVTAEGLYHSTKRGRWWAEMVRGVYSMIGFDVPQGGAGSALISKSEPGSGDPTPREGFTLVKRSDIEDQSYRCREWERLLLTPNGVFIERDER